jgi:lipopolysaccharide/colanic/teichoic acid biosynthesis glycosyltransferase
MRVVYRQNNTYMKCRRATNVALALLGLLLVAPIVLLAAVAIVLEDGFPVFFAQRRVGRFERTFVMYKLRSMRKSHCEDRESPTSATDARLTVVGRWLRKTSIDELPQLFNVVRGEMSLVGPRPEMPFIVKRYDRWQHLRHLIEPGLTCIWQTSCRSSIALNKPEATLMDLEYIRTASPATDGALMLKTLVAVFSSRGAY